MRDAHVRDVGDEVAAKYLDTDTEGEVCLGQSSRDSGVRWGVWVVSASGLHRHDHAGSSDAAGRVCLGAYDARLATNAGWKPSAVRPSRSAVIVWFCR